jgi:hypothetical protein
MFSERVHRLKCPIVCYGRFQHHLRETIGCASITFYISDRLSRPRTRLLRGRQPAV